jgi:hypothetical protein
MTSTTMQLHAALIWGGEPIANVVLDKPGPITIGPVASATFTVPDLGLPDVFTIVRPGERGYLLTIGNAMAGTVSLGGVQKRVTDLVGEAPFAATPVVPGDWGVVDLDGVGTLQLFFQVAPAVEQVVPRRGFDLESLVPATAFSVILHLLLLVATFVVTTAESAFVWPGPRALTGNYLVTRIEPVTPPPIKPLVVAAIPSADKPEPTQITPPKQAPVIATGVEGTAGGPRVKPDAVDAIAPNNAPDVGLTSRANQRLLAQLTNSRVDIIKFARKPGPGTGRVGTGPGTGGDEQLPGTPSGEDSGLGHKKQGEIDTEDGSHHAGAENGDGDRPGVPTELVLPPIDEVVVDDDSTLDPHENNKRIVNRRGQFGKCIQVAFNRDHTLGGKVTTRFTIGPDGKVTRVTIEKSTVRNADVASCVGRNLRLIQFPTSKNGGVVRYPFVFSGGR